MRRVVGRDRQPWHRSNGSWGTLCGLEDHGRRALLITRYDGEVTCKRCRAAMARLVTRYGSVAP